MTETRKINEERMLRVAGAILAEAETLDMLAWGKALEERQPIKPTCHSPACVAGWAGYLGLKAGELKPTDFECRRYSDVICDYLGLSAEQGQLLFYPSHWPLGLGFAYDKAMALGNARAAAEAAVGRIGHMIATGE